MQCPYCHDKSFAKTIHGVYCLGPHNDNKLEIANIETIKSVIDDQHIIRQDVLIIMETI